MLRRKISIPVRSGYVAFAEMHQRRGVSATACAEKTRKDHKSAIAIVPPRHLWPKIQEVRFRNDKNFLR